MVEGGWKWSRQCDGGYLGEATQSTKKIMALVVFFPFYRRIKEVMLQEIKKPESP